MNRPITGFRRDDHGDWTALLSCGHAQHVRHTPPFTNRPWVTTPPPAGTVAWESHCPVCAVIGSSYRSASSRISTRRCSRSVPSLRASARST